MSFPGRNIALKKVREGGKRRGKEKEEGKKMREKFIHNWIFSRLCHKLFQVITKFIFELKSNSFRIKKKFYSLWF